MNTTPQSYIRQSDKKYKINFFVRKGGESWSYAVFYSNGRKVKEANIPADIQEWSLAKALELNEKLWFKL